MGRGFDRTGVQTLFWLYIEMFHNISHHVKGLVLILGIMVSDSGFTGV